jgi:hypothetical protein
MTAEIHAKFGTSRKDISNLIFVALDQQEQQLLMLGTTP